MGDHGTDSYTDWRGEVPQVMEECPIHVTVGVTAFRDGVNTEEWLQETERKLYLAKYSGGNQVMD